MQLDAAEKAAQNAPEDNAAPEAESKDEEAEHGAGFYLCVDDPGVGVRTEPNESCGRSEDAVYHNSVREAVRLVNGTDSSGGVLQYLEWKFGGYSPLVNLEDHTEVLFKHWRPLKETMVSSSAISCADPCVCCADTGRMGGSDTSTSPLLFATLVSSSVVQKSVVSTAAINLYSHLHSSDHIVPH